jgi:hypothetical protein
MNRALKCIILNKGESMFIDVNFSVALIRALCPIVEFLAYGPL